jgi:hypothetical protein
MMGTLYEQPPPVMAAGDTQAFQQTKPPRPATIIYIDVYDLEIALSISSGYIININTQALRSVLADLKLYTQNYEKIGDALRDVKTNRQILLEI